MTTLGPGIRLGIWVQGCSIGCTGCLSLDTWSAPTSTQWVTIEALVAWLASHSDLDVDGITISGGEPFDQPDGLLTLLEELRSRPEFQDLDVLVYSGYTFAALGRKHQRILDFLDAVMAGPYVDGRPTALPWRGSSNQQLKLLTARARERYGIASPNRLQVSADGGQVWITGIPRRDDLRRLERELRARGVLVEDVSWRP